MPATIEGLKTVTDTKIRKQTAQASITPAIVADAVDAAFDFTAQEMATRAPVSHVHTAANISDFTEAVQDVVGAFFGGAGAASVTYNDANNTLVISVAAGTGGAADPEAIRDAIGAALVGVGAISVLVNDAADTITIATTATANATNEQLRDRTTHTGTQPISSVSGLQAKLNQLDAAVAAGGGDAGAPGDAATSLALDIDETLLDELVTYEEDGTTIKSAKLTLNMPEIINQVRAAITGIVTPSPTGDKENVAGPRGNTLDFLRLQTFVAPAPFTAADIEIAYGSNLAAVTAYQGAIDLGPGARPEGYVNGRIKGSATRNPSAWVKSRAVAAATEPHNYLPHSSNFADFAYFSQGTFDDDTNDGKNNALAPDGTMTANAGRNYNSGTINFPQATGVVNGNIYTLSICVSPEDIGVITGAQIFTNDNENIAVFKFAELEATMLTPTMRSAGIFDLSSVSAAWDKWYLIYASFVLQGNAIDYKLRLFGNYGNVRTCAPQINDGLVRTATLATV